MNDSTTHGFIHPLTQEFPVSLDHPHTPQRASIHQIDFPSSAVTQSHVPWPGASTLVDWEKRVRTKWMPEGLDRRSPQAAWVDS